jgi:hypothetical protein
MVRVKSGDESTLSFLRIVTKPSHPGPRPQNNGRLEPFSWIIEPPDEDADIDSEVRVSIDPVPEGSVMSIVHQRLDQPRAAKRHTAGWLGALDRLDSILRAEVTT